MKKPKRALSRKNHLKIEIKEELKNELVTREIFEKRFKSIDERFKLIDERFNTLNFKLNIFITIAVVALTLANPTFAELIKALFLK